MPSMRRPTPYATTPEPLIHLTDIEPLGENCSAWNEDRGDVFTLKQKEVTCPICKEDFNIH